MLLKALVCAWPLPRQRVRLQVARARANWPATIRLLTNMAAHNEAARQPRVEKEEEAGEVAAKVLQRSMARAPGLQGSVARSCATYHPYLPRRGAAPKADTPALESREASERFGTYLATVRTKLMRPRPRRL